MKKAYVMNMAYADRKGTCVYSAKKRAYEAFKNMLAKYFSDCDQEKALERHICFDGKGNYVEIMECEVR